MTQQQQQQQQGQGQAELVRGREIDSRHAREHTKVLHWGYIHKRQRVSARAWVAAVVPHCLIPHIYPL